MITGLTIDYHEVRATEEPILCVVCKTHQPASSFHSKNHEPAIFSNKRPLLNGKHFEQRICLHCKEFWDRSIKGRKRKDEKRWEFCEAKITKMFLDRGIPAVRTTRIGTDVMVTIFGVVVRIEVKEGGYESGNIVARPVYHTRRRDDVVAVVLPDDNVFWLPMSEYLKNSGSERFTFSRDLFEKDPFSFNFERAITSAGKLRGLLFHDLKLLPIKGLNT